MSTETMNWDLTSYFPEFNGPEMLHFKEALRKNIAELRNTIAVLASLREDNQAEWESVFTTSEEVFARLWHLDSYIGCLVATDSQNEAYQKEAGFAAQISAEFEKVKAELQRALKEVSDSLFESFVDREAFADAHYYLNRMRCAGQNLMMSDKEALAADLAVDGIKAWGRLYDTVTADLEFEVVYPDGSRKRFSLFDGPSAAEMRDPRVRLSNYEGKCAAWESVKEVAASALNAIVGTRLTLNKHRGIGHILDANRFQMAVSEKTLDALFEAIDSEIDIPRRIVRLKARLFGKARIPWYEMSSPPPFPDPEPISWTHGRSMVLDAFTRAYPALGGFFEHMVDRNWIEWEHGGGFCTNSLFTNESRIMLSYHNKIDDVRRLAHEAGHAFHNYAMRDLRPFAQHYPMTLAECASTFAQMILVEGALDAPDTSDVMKARLLEMELSNSIWYLIEDPICFKFEKAVYEERQKGELSSHRLTDMVVENQRRVLGDVLAEGGEFPYLWVRRHHFYLTDRTFTTYAYVFGYLISRGLFSMFKEEGQAFLPRYEEFLRLTGRDTCENVARYSIGRDLESPDFWVETIQSMEEPLNRLEALLPRVLPAPSPEEG